MLTSILMLVNIAGSTTYPEIRFVIWELSH